MLEINARYQNPKRFLAMLFVTCFAVILLQIAASQLREWWSFFEYIGPFLVLGLLALTLASFRASKARIILNENYLSFSHGFTQTTLERDQIQKSLARWREITEPGAGSLLKISLQNNIFYVGCRQSQYAANADDIEDLRSQVYEVSKEDFENIVSALNI